MKTFIERGLKPSWMKQVFQKEGSTYCAKGAQHIISGFYSREHLRAYLGSLSGDSQHEEQCDLNNLSTI